MAGKRMKRAPKKGNKNKDFTIPPPTQSLIYSGPIPSRTSERGITAILRQASTQTTGGAATSINVVLGNNPSGSDNWADYAAAWSQYRVLGMRVNWRPYDTGFTTGGVGTRSYGTFIHTVVHQTASPVTNSVANAFSVGDSRVSHYSQPHVRTWKMLDSTEAGWVATSAPATTSFAYSNYANNLTVASTYGVLFITYYVQFRTTNT